MHAGCARQRSRERQHDDGRRVLERALGAPASASNASRMFPSRNRLRCKVDIVLRREISQSEVLTPLIAQTHLRLLSAIEVQHHEYAVDIYLNTKITTQTPRFTYPLLNFVNGIVYRTLLQSTNKQTLCGGCLFVFDS